MKPDKIIREGNLEEQLKGCTCVRIFNLDIFGYRATVGPPWYDLLTDWVILEEGESTLLYRPTYPPPRS